MKKAFSLFYDSLDVLDDLSDEQAGQLFKAIRAYEINEDEHLDGIMKAVFNPFKNHLDRNKESYKKQVEANKANGLKGGRPKAKETHSVNLVKNKSEIKRNKAVTEKEKEKETKKEILPAWVDAIAWGEWVQHRKEIKKTLTKSTITKQLDFLQKNANSHVAIIHQSIQNGWAGLFEIKHDAANRTERNAQVARAWVADRNITDAEVIDA